jgi:hypothetical protein
MRQPARPQGTVGDVLEQCGLGTEQVVEIVYRPQAVFRVRSVTRCAASLPGMASLKRSCFVGLAP